MKFLVLNNSIKITNKYLFENKKHQWIEYHFRFKRFDGSILFNKVLINLF